MKCLEVRGSHSGHTVVAAALDCHPNVIIANRYGKPLTAEQVIEQKSDYLRWGKKGKYSFLHEDQCVVKDRILWVGNTGKMEHVDKVIGVVRNPYVMAYSLIKKHKTQNAVIKFMDNLFENIGEAIFYEDLLVAPMNIFVVIAASLELNATMDWLNSASSLVIRGIPQPKLDIDLTELFDKYDWLRRYK